MRLPNKIVRDGPTQQNFQRIESWARDSFGEGPYLSVRSVTALPDASVSYLHSLVCSGDHLYICLTVADTPTWVQLD